MCVEYDYDPDRALLTNARDVDLDIAMSAGDDGTLAGWVGRKK
jgi:hypothetical protein